MDINDLVRAIVREELDSMVQEKAENNYSKDDGLESIESATIERRRSSFDLDVELLQELKIQAVIHEINVYEIVENAIKKEVAELKKGLL